MDLTVEDIMCDQRIFTLDDNFTSNRDENNYLIVPSRKLWLQNVIYSLKTQLVPTLAAFLINSLTRSLAPLQKIPSSMIRVRLIRRRSKAQLAITNVIESAQIGNVVEEKQDVRIREDVPERCVNCTVLHEPEGQPHADIIFIHGLHGGLDRTWTQGTWRIQNPKLKDQTPVRRHSTGDMYVPVNEDQYQQEGKLKRTLTRIYSKIPAKIARKANTDTGDSIALDEQNEEKDESDLLNNELNFSKCWPKDWLPQDCPGVRIIAINYTTDVLWRPLWQKMKARTNLKERSEEMIEELLSLGVGNRPIVWVGHSKGGLFIKQIILNAKNTDEKNQDLKNLFEQTKAIMFYSVPHKGSPVADMIFPFFKRSIEVLEVQRNCEIILELHKRFLDIFDNENINKPEVFSFIDTENTPVAFTSLKFIAYESADPNIGTKCTVPLNHREICKPAGRDCFLYLELVKLIQRTIFNKET